MKKFLAAIFALLVLAVSVLVLAIASKWFLHWLFQGVSPTISAAIVAAAATTSVSVLGVALGRYLERRHQIEVELRERKIPMYTEFVNGLMKIFNQREPELREAADGLVDSQFDLVEFFREMTPRLMVWASDEVVSKWSVLRRDSDERELVINMFMLEDLLTSIRKDLGHPGAIPKGHLLGLFVNDIREYLAAPSPD